ncbi:MAG: hypothetical protein GY943_16970 [Chloroflexi bacterium]|nr:hypothetical protein [Chloroflexota bacterium]
MKKYQLISLFAIPLVGIIFLFAAIQSHAAPESTYIVDSTLDEVDTNPGDGVCHTASNSCTLRAAVQEANAHSGQDTVVLSNNIYTLTISGFDEDFSTTGDLDIRDDIIITGVNPLETIIDGNQIDRVFQIISGFELQFSNITVQNGSTDQGAGFHNSGTLTVNRSMILSNTATIHGGGIYNSGSLTVSDSTLAYNDANLDGSSIINLSGGQVSINNSTSSHNSTNGIFNAYGTINITNSTIVNEVIFAAGQQSIQFQNSILYLSANSSNYCDDGGEFVSLGHNIESGDDCGFNNTGDLINTDALLSPLQDNGGNILTHALLYGSKAIDAGFETACPQLDQRNKSRPIDGNKDGTAVCDIGAYEYNDPIPTTMTIIVNSTIDAQDATPGDNVCETNTGNGECTLRAALQEANAQIGIPTTISLPAGTYSATISGMGDSGGDFNLSNSITIQGAGADQTIIANTRAGSEVININYPGTSSILISDVTIRNCAGFTGCGGVVFHQGGNLTIRNSSITNGHSHYFSGGGILNHDKLQLINSTVSNNKSDNSGGGIQNNGTMSIINSTISNNSMNTFYGAGGGINSYGKLEIINSTIAFNEDSPGADRGLFQSGNEIAVIKNSIFVGNQCGGTNIVSNGNNIESGDSCNFNQNGDLPNTDPLLTALQDNGGKTLTHALQTNSPAIDAADNNACPVDDQAGTLRPLDGDGNNTAVCDIGAVEYGTGTGISIAISNSQITEGDNDNTDSRTAIFNVTLSASASLPITVTYHTFDGSATAGTDYTTVSSQLAFAPGETEKQINIPIISDLQIETQETFLVILLDPINAVLMDDGIGIGTINDNDEYIYLYLPLIISQ